MRIIDGTSNTLLIGEYTTKSNFRRTSFWAYSYTSYCLSTVTAVNPFTLACATAQSGITP